MNFVEKYSNPQSIKDNSFMSIVLCCEVCGNILKLTINLKKHMKTVHLANLSFMSKPYVVSFVEKYSNQLSIKGLSFMSKPLAGVYLPG